MIKNKDFIEKIESIVRFGLILLTVVGILLDIICIKWKRVAHALFYLEFGYVFLSAMISVKMSTPGMTCHELVALSLLISLSLSCDPLPNLIFLTIFLLQLTFLQFPVVWSIRIDEIYVVESALLIIGTLTIFLLTWMLVSELAQTR